VKPSAGPVKLSADAMKPFLRNVILPAAVVYLCLVGVGLLLTHPLARVVRGEDVLNRDLAADRTSTWSAVTKVFSTLADTTAVIATVAVLAVVLRLAYGRWRESLTLIVAVALQAAVFLATTLVVHRPRPAVPHLDPAPPTSSYPSGHVGATTALYVGLALVVGWHLRHRLPRLLLFAALVTIPLAVGASRLYRGMHHPTDVILGLLNGLACLMVAANAFPLRPGAGRSPRAASPHRPVRTSGRG
jgi:membrane-associated phospholipid phosphatase